uniref:Uncharacterized protein n=5 Tax=Oryza TaxID=4527 RepID=Q10GM6_ORYSJ|nr:hypothetical protein [Oryza sativa Japonica Group]ABF97675.1 hypothetical protein LOC_Os03g42400 [Oryza sativa Japonica Group]
MSKSGGRCSKEGDDAYFDWNRTNGEDKHFFKVMLGDFHERVGPIPGLSLGHVASCIALCFNSQLKNMPRIRTISQPLDGISTVKETLR